AEPLEMLVPVRVLDDHLDVRVGAARRPKDEVLCHLPHLAQPVLGPALRAFGADIGVATRVVEREVIEDHGVEVARRLTDGAPRRGDVLRVLVIEGAKRPSLIRGGQRDAAIDRDAVRAKETRDPIERRRIGEEAAAVVLEVHLVEVDLAPDAVELLLQHLRVGELVGGEHRDVDRDTEVLVRPLRRGGLSRATRKQQTGRGQRTAESIYQSLALTHHALPARPAHDAQWTLTAAPEYSTVLSAGAAKSSPGRACGDIQRIWNARLCCIPGNSPDLGPIVSVPVARS